MSRSVVTDGICILMDRDEIEIDIFIASYLNNTVHWKVLIWMFVDGDWTPEEKKVVDYLLLQNSLSKHHTSHGSPL